MFYVAMKGFNIDGTSGASNRLHGVEDDLFRHW